MMQFVFSQLDSWCFREARPMGAVGGTAIESVFPPPASTLVGACRTLIGDSQNINWRDFAAGKLSEMSELIGTGEHTGALQFEYPYLQIRQHKKTQRLYPVPAILMQHDKGITAMQLGSAPVKCDLGQVLLPELPSKVFNAKPFEHCWITEQGLSKFAQGNMPDITDIIDVAALLTKEVRLGIGRNAQTASVESGMLYQTEHIRLNDGYANHRDDIEQVELVVNVSGVPNAFAEHLMQHAWQVRLGGEGRLAHVQVQKATNTPSLNAKASTQALLYFSAPADLGAWLPSDFVPKAEDGVDFWEGSIGGQHVKIHAACIGKALKVGGWDSALRKPKPVRSLLPAGACFFISCDEPKQLSQCLSTFSFGQQTSFGYGAAMLLPAPTISTKNK